MERPDIEKFDWDNDSLWELVKKLNSYIDHLRTENERLRGLKDWIMSAQVSAEQGECLMPNITDVLNEIERLTQNNRCKTICNECGETKEETITLCKECYLDDCEH